MQMRRARTPQSLKHIEDRLLDGGEFSDKKIMLQVLATRLADDDLAKQTFVLVIINEKDKNKVVGHVIAVSNPIVPFVFVYEAEYDNKLQLPDRMQLVMQSKQLVIDWALLQGKNLIRMQTARNPEAWQRAWNLRPIATIMEYKIQEIDSDLEDVTPIQPTETEQSNERRIDSGIVTDGRPEGVDRGDHEADSRGAIDDSKQPSGAGSTAVPGTSSRKAPERNGRPRGSVAPSLPDDELADIHERSASKSVGAISV